MLNCKDYWSFYKIKNPLVGSDLSNVDKCNFYCMDCETNEFKSFCTDQVMHTFSNDWRHHNFNCECNEKKVYKGIDICFTIDSTGSMSKYIEKSRDIINKIVKESKIHLDKINENINSLRISVVAYRDHCDGNKITEQIEFTDAKKAIDFLTNLEAFGGGDAPEAVADGLDISLKLNWRQDSNDKFLFLVLDSPPHGRQYINRGDDYPDGCPCNLNIKTILNELIDKKGIKVYVLKLNSSLNLMEKEFKKYNSKIVFIDTETSNSLLKIEETVVSVVCKALEDKEITIQKY
ncbi:unnamed protein product [Brachionus calyciflorus]|uniref:VWFA domain-containing protein n=1 Tax=Brachionus calyciflorus TaxID=104777 RepID=A0A814LKK8_9BILA|nr:unnamed protein product [Brachionus calyciflorus]